MALVLLFWVPRRRNWLAMLGLLVLSVAIGTVGCGGGSSSSKENSGTTAGLYTVTVTGTSGTASATVGTVAVTVQ
jgi:ABC-type glycerol-3-phosphate transport system substrate-binding protein